jgi:hypothetical protein
MQVGDTVLVVTEMMRGIFTCRLTEVTKSGVSVVGPHDYWVSPNMDSIWRFHGDGINDRLERGEVLKSTDFTVGLTNNTVFLSTNRRALIAAVRAHAEELGQRLREAAVQYNRLASKLE